MTDDVTVVIGTGGMGEAIARRLGSGVHLVLADVHAGPLEAVTARLRSDGYRVSSVVADVSEPESVALLAERAAAAGPVRALVHTAGLSPTQADVPAILAVDLLGVALVLEAFGPVVADGAAAVVIASMAGHMYPAFTDEQAGLLARTPARELLDLPFAAPDVLADSGAAYGFAKRANQVRVQSANAAWAPRGGRVNSISPGIIATAMGQAEMEGEHGAQVRAMLAASNAGRAGTAADIAAAAEFLLSPAARFVAGADLLVDGGVTAALRTGRVSAG